MHRQFIIKNWFYKNFELVVQKFFKENNLLEKAILIIDKVSFHAGEQEVVIGNVNIKFVPGNLGKLKELLGKIIAK